MAGAKGKSNTTRRRALRQSRSWDHLSATERSAVMARIRSRNTRPEVLVRTAIRSLGYAFSTRPCSSLGSPDFVFRKLSKVIFVHGCFWHRHSCRRGKSIPTARKGFWETKFKRNRRRDAQVQRLLRKAGWKSLILWECGLRDISTVHQKLSSFLGTTSEKSTCSPADMHSVPRINLRHPHVSVDTRHGRDEPLDAKKSSKKVKIVR
jgi:DNA mismatch endonuclease (patch repair protein)